MVATIVSAPPAASLSLSVVSHGQRDLVAALAGRLARMRDPHVAQLIVTHNLPEQPLPAPAEGWPFEFVEIFNREPAGFAANHNRAMTRATAPFFGVLNPDVELHDHRIWQALLQTLEDPEVGCAYPRLLEADGSPQDQEREAVTPAALWRRYVLRRPQQWTDWVSGAFWVVRAEAWRALGGLDERFRMYCEDTDFCLRLQLAGWRIASAPVEVLHLAARDSRRPGRRMAWHIHSLLRLWFSPTLWRYLSVYAKARQ